MTTQDEVGLPKVVYPKSISSLKMYRTCGRQWEEVKFNKVARQPAAWLPQGTAYHAVIDAFEKSHRTITTEERAEVYHASFDAEMEKYLKEVPNLSQWLTMGRTGIEKDIENRRPRGLEQAERRVARCFAEEDIWQVWELPDGSPAVEVPFQFTLGEDIMLRGYIDKIVTKNNVLLIEDEKTGNREETAIQLGAYAVGANEMFGEEIIMGRFYYAKDDTYSNDLWLQKLGKEYLLREFTMMERGVKNRVFNTNPGKHCALCPAKTICPEEGST